MDSFAAPEGGGAGGSDAVVEYVRRLVLGRRRRQRNGCLGLMAAISGVCDFAGLDAVVVGKKYESLSMIEDESR